ncbi:MAG: hypothetical protein U9N12_06065, partial [Euryarchaeota archaeon]|nr:hypothetical protein [Euryarchaeota archaeon]
RVAPHIIVGLGSGALDGELRALDIVRRYDPAAVVIVVFIPTRETGSADAPHPTLEDVSVLIAKAGDAFGSMEVCKMGRRAYHACDWHGY